MFSRKSNQHPEAAVTTTPGIPSEASRRTFFARGSAISLERNHWRAATFALAGAVLLCAVAIFRMLPLVRVQAVLVHESKSGELVAQAVDDRAFSPDQAAIAYALNNWASNLVTVNGTIQQELVDQALAMTAGQGTDQVKSFYQVNNPAALIRHQPEFLRTYHYLSINFINANAALLRFETTDRKTPGGQPESAIFDMTVSFAIAPPKTVNEAIHNPSGVYVTSFNINKEAAK
jgi:type IV secretory pathway component VirB8